MLELLLIRHAESVGNAEGRMMGQRHDPLTPLGQQQAQQLASRLASRSPDHIYASPLQRAAETAKILQQGAGAPLTYLDALQEFQNGIFAGLTWAEAQGQYPALCAQLATTPDWLPIPGAETLATGRGRAERSVEQLLNHRSGERIWVVSHQWILQQVFSALLGSDRTWGLPLHYTGIIELWLDRDRWGAPAQAYNSSLWQIRCFNDIGHLAP